MNETPKPEENYKQKEDEDVMELSEIINFFNRPPTDEEVRRSYNSMNRPMDF